MTLLAPGSRTQGTVLQSYVEGSWWSPADDAQAEVVVDASTGSGHPPGTLFRVPGERLAQLPPPQGINLHAFRWDQALAFGRWLLKDDYPAEVVVWLVEAQSLGHGDPLSPVVERTMRDLAERLLAELTPQGGHP